MIIFRFEQAAKDVMVKEAFAAALSESKIIFRFNEESEGYQQVLIENGILVIQCKPERFWTNIGNIASLKVETIIPSSGKKEYIPPKIPLLRLGLPFTLQKNIRDYEPKMKNHLKKISEHLGKEITFETNWADIYAVVDKSYKERLGEILYDSYLSNVESL